jgi:formylglycine-generating enzyme required for sulfatase activity
VGRVEGSGAVAQGEKAKAAGERGVAADEIHGTVITGDENRIIEAETYVERQEVHVDPARAQAEIVLERYLRNLRRLCNALPLTALSEEEGPHRRAEVTLNRVYIALNTTSLLPSEEEAAAASMDQDRAEVRLRAQERVPLSALSAADREERLVILGDPGSGKSTFVNYLAYLLAGARLGGDSPPEGWTHGDLLPLRVILRELVAHLPDAEELRTLSTEQREARLSGAVWTYLRHELAATYRAEEAFTLVEEEVDRCRSLVIFDGLDEVAPGQRGTAREAVQAFSRLCAGNRVLVTCRVLSYQGNARLPVFADETLAPFTEEQIDGFVGRWYQALADLGTLTPREADRRAEDLRAAVQRMEELARIPLLLTTMAVVHTAQVGLPRERARLYQRCVEVLLRRWHQHKAGQVSLLSQLGVAESELLAALWEVAYQAHEHGGAQAGDLPRSEVLRILAARLGGSYGDAQTFLEYVDARSGLLVGKGGTGAVEPVYAFPHRTFQEYLAGCYLALGGRNYGRRLRGLLDAGDRWALAARLGAEHLLYNVGVVTEVLDAAYTLCPVAEPRAEEEWRGVLWAGAYAAEVGRRRVEEDEEPDGGIVFLERLVPRLVRILGEGHLGSLERTEAGNVLAQLGDPRFRGDAWHLPDEPLLGFVEVPEGRFTMGCSKERYARAYDDESPEHTVVLPSYYVGRYPVTHAQYLSFVQATGHRQPTAEIDSERPYEWHEGTPPRHLLHHPVVLVTWHDAVAYCRWLTGELRAWEGTPDPLKSLLCDQGWEVRLPSEAQWEKAARGTDGRLYPWGDDPDPDRANYGDTGIGTTSGVGCFPRGASPYGCEDMSGNAWEWTRSLWGKSYSEPEFKYPYDPTDGREDLQAGNDVYRVVRGGSFLYSDDRVRCASRYRLNSFRRNWYFGLRVVVSPGFPSGL